MSTAPEYLFVYGTLRSRFGAHRLLAGRAHPVGRGRIQGQLYDAGGYPAAVPPAESDEWVYGELYALSPESASELLSELDRYEGFVADVPETSLFRRTRVEVTVEDGSVYLAWVYLFHHSVRHLARILSGDYADPTHDPEPAR